MAQHETRNAEIADALDELADLQELDGAVSYRVLAYRTAARSVRDCALSVAALAREGRAVELPGIGRTIQEKILEVLRSGEISAAARLRARYPPGLVEITHLSGIGAKRARQLYEALGVDSPQALRLAAERHRIRELKGYGAKSEQRILEAVRAAEHHGPAGRTLLPRAQALAEAIAAGLREHGPDDADVELAGSIRRAAETVRDIDLIGVSEQPERLARTLAQLPEIESVSSAGPAGAKAQTHAGLRVDLRVAAPAQRGNLLQHFSGSAAHNASLREAAVKMGLHVSEHGILNERTGERIVCAAEREVYEALGLEWIPPELREDRGELEAARLAGGGPGLPKLIVEADLQGDLHCHTLASDGRASIAEMAAAAQARGHRYLAITDHSASHGFGNAVSPAQLRDQVERIRELNGRLEEIELLAGSEVNILPDGQLDYEDELLGELDWVVASVHTAFERSEQRMTERVLRAVEHPLVDAIGHPTGRLIESRDPYALDLPAVIEAAARTGTMLEINASPQRRDLDELHARTAARAGVKLAIDSDAHGPEMLGNLRWGVATARRAWLSREDVANTRPWPELQGMRKRARATAAGGGGR